MFFSQTSNSSSFPSDDSDDLCSLTSIHPRRNILFGICKEHLVSRIGAPKNLSQTGRAKLD